MHHAHDASTNRTPRVRAVAVPHATSVEVALPIAILLLALLVLLL